jgi:ATP phosphoribosyltransferase
MKAVTVGNEYALNFLPAHFLVQAREILEQHTLKRLQENRKAIATEITQRLRDHFDKYGFTLINVGIGAISKIDK